MTFTRPLLWKEWAEAKSILIIGTIIFLVLPLIGALEHIIQYHRFEIWTSPWVVILGGVLAVVAGVGVIIPDITRRFEFIRSQPIPLTRWILTKYFVGLAVILPTLIVPLALEWISARSPEFSGFHLVTLLVTLPFIWVALYSIAFALACVIRRTSLAIVLGIFATIVVYFLPPVLPGLELLSLDRVTSDLTKFRGDATTPLYATLVLHPSFFVFVVTLIGIAFVALLISIAVVNRDWRIESNRKTIAWTLAILILAPMATASLQLGSNMPVLQTFPLTVGGGSPRLLVSGDDMFLVISRLLNQAHSDRSYSTQTFMYRIKMGPQLELGPAFQVSTTKWDRDYTVSPTAGAMYSMVEEPADDPRPEDKQYDPPRASYPVLTALPMPGAPGEPTRLEMRDQAFPEYGMPVFFFDGPKMTVISGLHQLTFNIADALHPKLISRKALNARIGFVTTDQKIQFRYATDSDVPGDRQIAAHSQQFQYGVACDGQTCLYLRESQLQAYRRAESGPGFVNFNLAGHYTSLPIEKLVEKYRSWRVAFSNDRAVTANGRINLFDVSDPSHPRRIGHYASPRELNEVLGILPDGRVLVGSQTQLTVLGKPGT